jgi:transposase
MAYQRVEILTGSERRRTYTAAEKARLVAEAFRPGVVVKEAARRLGVHESLLYRWRQTLGRLPGPTSIPEFLAVTVVPEVESGLDPCEAAPLCAALPVSQPVAERVPTLEITLVGGAKVRLEGTVDPVLVVTVLKALTAPGRTA